MVDICLTKLDLKIKVEAVNSHVPIGGVEGAGNAGCGVVGAKDLVHLVSKMDAVGSRRDLVIVGAAVHATNAQDDLDALILAIGDVRLQALAVLVQGRRDTISVSVRLRPAMGREVDARVFQVRLVVLRSRVDETQGNRANTTITISSQALVVFLTLRKMST